MTMRRRTAGGLALVLGAAVLSLVPPAQAATWLPGVSASGLGDVFDPQVVVDAGGVATAVWVGSGLSGFEIQTATRGAGAADFGPVQTLGAGRRPSVVLHPDGAVTVAWDVNRTIVATTRGPDMATFPPAELVAPVSGDTVDPSNLTVDGAGNAWVSWRSAADFVDAPAVETCWTARRDAESGSWGDRERVAEGPSVETCVIEAATDGTVTYAWSSTVDSGGPGEREQVWARTRSAEGTLGGAEPMDVAPGRLNHFALTDNLAGVTALSWSKTDALGEDLQVALRPETDGAFGTHHGLSGDEVVNGAVALVLDEAGRVTGGWAAAAGGVIGVSRTSDGTLTTTPLDVGGRRLRPLDAAVDPRGAVTLVWESGGSSILASRGTAEGVFEAPTALSGDAAIVNEEAALDVAPSGDVTVVYESHPRGSFSSEITSQVLDVNAPALSATVPTSGTGGAALSMSATPGDLWGPVSVAWDFGDGATATGTSVSHTYAGAGSFVVRVTATDGSGNATTLTRTVNVAAVPQAAPVGDRTPPVLSRARLAPDLLPTGHGAKLKVTSTEAGRLVGVVERRKQNGQWREIGAKRWSLQAGRSSKTFYGQAAQLRLDTGKHRVRLVATDAAGNASSPVVLRFRVGPR